VSAQVDWDVLDRCIFCRRVIHRDRFVRVEMEGGPELKAHTSCSGAATAREHHAAYGRAVHLGFGLSV